MNFSWPLALHPVPLNDEVHVWAWNTSRNRDDEFNAILSPDEILRMNRFRFPLDRRRYLACHANLRILLAAYTGLPPRQLAFHANQHGKPSLNQPVAFYFNLSHSHDIGLLAVTRVAAIGIDVECVRPIEPEVATSHFSRAELADLAQLSPQQWLTGFFHCWTRKEAILKAEGCGLNLPLDSFDVSLLPGQPALLRAVRPQAALHHHWRLQHLQPAPSIIGAVAVGADFTHLRCFQFQD